MKPSKCIVWTGNINHKGYGWIVKNSRMKTCVMAHRAMYEGTYGKIQKGLVIDHLCRNRACINPKHLKAVTVRENVLEKRSQAIAAINSRKKCCPRGHKYSYVHNNKRYCKICQVNGWRKRYGGKLQWSPRPQSLRRLRSECIGIGITYVQSQKQ